MIYLDTTTASSWKHASGLARVSGRLRDELGGAATAAVWPEIAALPGKADWILTPELFSERERPGFTAFLEKRPCRLAAVYHDAIPLKHPDITWPMSVERHAGYMKLLARFDRVWAVSSASRDELLAFWKWQGVVGPPQVDVLRLGADWRGIPRRTTPRLIGPTGRDAAAPKIVCVGILEPRKNQAVILDACAALLLGGLNLELHLVGRLNPHFGMPIAHKMGAMGSEWPGLHYHSKMGDAELATLVESAHATAFASIAEGCGLPLLESLWMGVPCLCSDIAPLLENAAGGGCDVIAGNGVDGWTRGLRRILTDAPHRARLAAEATSRELPTWAGAARALRDALA
jgi:glycosyltransferase involved in cell wall biosynthesis